MPFFQLQFHNPDWRGERLVARDLLSMECGKIVTLVPSGYPQIWHFDYWQGKCWTDLKIEHVVIQDCLMDRLLKHVACLAHLLFWVVLHHKNITIFWFPFSQLPLYYWNFLKQPCNSVIRYIPFLLLLIFVFHRKWSLAEQWR